MMTSHCNPEKRPVTIIVECQRGFEVDALRDSTAFLESLALPEADWGQPQVVEVIPGACFRVFDLPLAADVALLAAREWRCRFERRDEVVLFFINGVGLAALAKNCGEASIASLPVTIVGLSVRGWRGKSTPTNIKVLSNLTSLALRECESLTDLSPIADLTQLRSLYLSGGKFLTNLSPIANMTQLASLNLSCCMSTPDVSPIASLTQLRSLDLSSCHSLTDVVPIANLTQLRSLNLSGCESLTDLSPIASLTQLTRLDLSSCPNIMSVNRLEPVLDLPCLLEFEMDAPDLRSFVLLQSACARNDAAAISTCIKEMDLIDILQRTESSRDWAGALARSIGIAGRSLPARFASDFLDQCLELASLSGESWQEILREVARGDSASLATWLQGLQAADDLPNPLLSGLLNFVAHGGKVEHVGWPELLHVLLGKPSRDQQFGLGPQIVHVDDCSTPKAAADAVDTETLDLGAKARDATTEAPDDDEDRIDCPFCRRMLYPGTRTAELTEWYWDDDSSCVHLLFIYEDHSVCDFVYRNPGSADLLASSEKQAEAAEEADDADDGDEADDVFGADTPRVVSIIQEMKLPGYTEREYGVHGWASGVTYFGFTPASRPREVAPGHDA